MVSLIRKSLTWRTAILFGMLMSVGLVLSGLISLNVVRQVLHQEVVSRLSLARDIRKDQIREYLREKIRSLQQTARCKEVQARLSEDSAPTSYGKPLEGDLYRDTSSFSHATHLKDGFWDLVLLKADRPTIVARIRHGRNNAADSSVPAEEPIRNLWIRVKEKHAPVLMDFVPYDPVRRPCPMIGVPVQSSEGKLAGVLAAALDPEVLEARLLGMGEALRKERFFLVGPDGRTRLASDWKTAEPTPLQTEDQDLISAALRGTSGEEKREDVRGGSFIGVYAPLELPSTFGTDFDWVIFVEMPQAQASAVVRSLAFKFAGLAFVLVLVGCPVGYGLSRSIVAPIQNLSAALKSIGEGNLDISISTPKRDDEVGELFRGFDQMLQSLRSQTQRILESVNNLASATSEISATSSQLAASSAETATSISQISSTVEEVHRMARLSQDKANEVSQRAEQTAQISQEGRQVTEDVLQGLHHIRKEMEFVAENVMRLSEQSRHIGDIIEAVRDLADQVNLLSVNAAIEAAKAGEQGKGFVVVAQEMRSLADQSKEATEQVKQILTEIQKGTSGAVLAIERGTKAAAAGLELGEQAGEAIRRLAETVEASSESALQIAASSQEQVVGMEQLVHAVQNIRDAMSQNTEAAHQIEESVRDLDRLSQALKEVTDRFRLRRNG